MIHAQALDLVKRDEHSGKEKFVFFLERKGESIDNGPKDLQKFSNSVESLGFISELEKDIVDGATDE